jgi:hypothetical protein
MIDYCEIADQINICPEMTKTLLLKLLVSVGHVINYEPETNNIFYSTFVIYPVQCFINMIIHW